MLTILLMVEIFAVLIVIFSRPDLSKEIAVLFTLEFFLEQMGRWEI